jgi:hypothetical protein
MFGIAEDKHRNRLRDARELEASRPALDRRRTEVVAELVLDILQAVPPAEAIGPARVAMAAKLRAVGNGEPEPDLSVELDAIRASLLQAARVELEQRLPERVEALEVPDQPHHVSDLRSCLAASYERERGVGAAFSSERGAEPPDAEVVTEEELLPHSSTRAGRKGDEPLLRVKQLVASADGEQARDADQP